MEIQFNNNLDQWCFDYLENQLSTSNKKAFEAELKKNKKASECLEKWKASTITSISYIEFDQELLIRISKESKKSALRIIIPIFAALVAIGLFVYFNYSKTEFEEIENSIISEIKEDKKDTTLNKPVSTEKKIGEIIPNGIPTPIVKTDSNTTIKKDSIPKKRIITNTPEVKRPTPFVPKKSVPKPTHESEEIIEPASPTIQIPTIIVPPTPIETPTPLQVPETEKELSKKEKRKIGKN